MNSIPRLFAVVLSLLGQAAIACSPEVGSQPASLAERLKTATYVFEGIVTAVNPPQVTIKVVQYFKGRSGPNQLTMTGFNEHSCSDFLTLDQHAIFFGEGEMSTLGTLLTAVYDDAFGSIQEVSSENIAAIAAAVDCMATYHNGQLHVPCIAVTGIDKIYGADLSWHALSNPMLFSVTDVQASSGINKPRAHIETIDIVILESFPVQVRVVAKGYFSDGCGRIDQIHTIRAGNSFNITITTRSVGEACTQALVPFEEVIELNVYGLKAGTYTVDVNGVTDTFKLDVDNILNTD
ncbi:MAG: hypothetical protein ABFS56_13865 [Pseudomonadota bacterium]